MKKLFVFILFVLFFWLIGCDRPFDQESYTASVMNFEYQMSPDVLFEEFVFVSDGGVLLEDLLITYSDLSLYLQDWDVLLEDIKKLWWGTEIERAAKKYYFVLQKIYKEDLNNYVMLVAWLLRRHEDVSKNENILVLEKTMKTQISSSWKEFFDVYNSYLDSNTK